MLHGSTAIAWIGASLEPAIRMGAVRLGVIGKVAPRAKGMLVCGPNRTIHVIGCPWYIGVEVPLHGVYETLVDG